MTVDDMTANELAPDALRDLLALEPDATCGFVRVTFVSRQPLAPGGLPAPVARFVTND
jgi:hypothetical protein